MRNFQTLKKTPEFDSPTQVAPADLRTVLDIKTSSQGAFIESLPFSGQDTTAGSENELQVAVLGTKENLDLAVTIEDSNYYKNLMRRAARGDTSRRTIIGLESYLAEKKNNVWENSWVRFPRRVLNAYSNNIFNADLKSDKTNPTSCLRSDASKFMFTRQGEDFIRVPVSYMLKLALADAVGSGAHIHPLIRTTGERMLAHFSNDNTSPELFSFYPVSRSGSASVGHELAKETSVRFLFTQMLVAYAEEKFLLREYGQQVRVFFSASPPVMQKQLNGCISDSFYRHLFMNPCLSGWSKGEEKHGYMKLCHKVLSRSQINGIAKLKEAGIINSNLVTLPSSSNISLANNGTHISIGSKKLGDLLKNSASGFAPAHEKYMGDLVIKIVEHFLCLFPGTFSASPHRLNFEDFHPEQALGFLPHEIDYTHLRMIWRRWKRKASIRIFGKSVTPFGPVWLDRLISRCFLLKGDYIPDFRLIDYFISLMSTHQSPALDGIMGNGDQLKNDLTQMGIFDTRMPLYQLVRIREHAQMGYSGFEHRYFSIFENLITDMGPATDFENLITLLAYQYVLDGSVDHTMIPDSPEIESERRQIFFCSAIDLPTFFVKTGTQNKFLTQILSRVKKTRQSRRYPGYTRIHLKDYKLALLDLIHHDGQGLIENLNLKGMMTDIESRIRSPKTDSTGGKLLNKILAAEKSANPMNIDGRIFNEQAEQFYIETLRKQHIMEGFNVFTAAVSQSDFRQTPEIETAVNAIFGASDPAKGVDETRQAFLTQNPPLDEMINTLFLMILFINHETNRFDPKVKGGAK